MRRLFQIRELSLDAKDWLAIAARGRVGVGIARARSEDDELSRAARVDLDGASEKDRAWKPPLAAAGGLEEGSVRVWLAES